jgi:dynein heavy chain
MVESMQEVCRQGLEAYAATPRASWVLQWPSQVVLAISAIYWTQELAEAMQGAPAAASSSEGGAAGGQGSKGALGAVAAKCTSQLNEVVELVRGELSVLDRYEALVQ